MNQSAKYHGGLVKSSFAVTLWGITVFCVLNSWMPIASADDYTSTNFISRNPVFSVFGNRATSTSFEQFNAGGQTITGISSSASFELRSGFLYFDERYEPKSQNWRWYDDETNETPTSDLAAENVAPTSITDNNKIKLRLTLKDTVDITGTNIKFKLQFSENSDFSSGVNDVVEIGSCTGSSLWCYADGVDADNATITTGVITDSTALGTHNESGVSASTFDPPADASTEFEFTIKASGAAINTTYFFRAYNVTDNVAVAKNVGETYPSLTTQGTTLSFTVGGLSSGTTTEGVTTDVTTTPTSVALGSLTFDAQIDAAQRLTVSTNAANGYKVLAYERQPLQRSGGVQIDPVTGTNNSPSAWATGCTGTAYGCYGYHSGDNLLEGGSTRFSVDDTYAQFAGTSEEVAYNSGAIENDINDIVYKVKITNQQAAGQYSSNVVYIVVPVF